MEDNNMFVPEYDGQYTKDEIDVLNMEVTPEIEAILNTMLLEKAASDAEGYVPASMGTDMERELSNNLDLFEDYIRISAERDMYQKGWETIRYARSSWWSLFKEEMDENWMELVLFDTKLDKRMLSVQPTDEQWKKARTIRSMIHARCVRKQQARREYTYSIYLKAMAATKKCREYWNTPAGKELSRLNDERSTIWGMISDLDCTWEDYNNLIGMEINKYWTNGDTEEVDSMEMMCTSVYETMDLLEDASHEEDSQYNAPQSKSRGYWNYKSAAISVYQGKAAMVAKEVDDAYTKCLMEFMDSYLGEVTLYNVSNSLSDAV